MENKILKKITKNNSITLPRQLRTAADLFAGNAVEIDITDDVITIKKAVSVCFVCGSVEAVIPAGSHYICKNCVRTLATAVNTGEGGCSCDC